MSRSKSRRRRNGISNRRLPTSHSYSLTSVTAHYSALRRALLSPSPYEPGEYSRRVYANELPSSSRPAPLPVPRSRRLPKAYNPQTTQREVVRPDLCVSRAIRSEVIHAINKAGKVGQKPPRWTKLSKLRCK